MIKIGATVVHVERLGYLERGREILRTTIVRETATQWIDAHGDRWRKSDFSRVRPCHGCGPRFIISVEDFTEAAS